ncbi:MAG: transposase, partial [Planctomycetota bacterium]
MLLDRLSFRRFVGLTMDDKTPDETTFVIFRRRLRQHGHSATLFDITVKILKQRGLILEEGTCVDATITHAQAEHVAAVVDALPEFGHRFFAKTGTDAFGESLKNSLENSLFSPTFHGKTGQSMAIGVNQKVSFGGVGDEGKNLNNNPKTNVLTPKSGSV